jgi:ATP-binding cassette, subfamily A (ABC1), member 3
MVLTTHFLDEADVLADHIAIISLGRLQCEGSAVELKSRFGGGYRVYLQGQKSGPDLGFLTKHLWDHTVYNAPDSAGAAVLLSALDSHGYSDVFVNGPTVEDVFLRVAHGTYAAQDASVKGDDSNLTPTRARAVSEVSMKLSSGQGTSFIRQIQILSRKRYTVLLRNWLPYFFAFLIPIAATPALKTLLSSYNAPQCTRVSSTNSNPLQPLNIQYISEHIGNLQLLTGPVSVNQTLHHVLTEFPIGVGLNLSNYTNQFLFANSWDSFQQHVMDMYANTTPGALYMESNISTPIYAFVGDLGILPAMLMQNLWTQIRSGLPIAAYYAALDSLVPVSARRELVSFY